jgi:transglutaminase-like putative cysteine protease
VLYDISLTITYTYDSPAIAGRQALRLAPANVPGLQRPIAGHVKVRPLPDERRDIVDFFGNQVVETAFRHAHAEIELLLQSRVERFTQAPRLDMSPCLADLGPEIAARLSLDPDAPHHFLSASPRVRPSAAITAFAADFAQPGASTLEVVDMLSRGLNRAMTFDAEATQVDTTPDEAFARRKGVCQDFTHILIAALRSVGVPAGYVSGFLRTIPPPGAQRLEGADAMHAWVRAWCGEQMGWIEVDPTNGIRVGADHIIVAYGRDYGDVAPVKGVLRSAGAQQTRQAVDVIPLGG